MAFSSVIFVTTLLIGVKVLSSRVEYFRNRALLVTGTRTSSGMMLLGRSRNSSTDSLQALALLSTNERLDLKTDSPKITVTMQVDMESLRKTEERITYRVIRDYVFQKYGIKTYSTDIACVKEKYGLLERKHRAGTKKPRIEHCPLEKEALIVEALKHFGIIPDDEG